MLRPLADLVATRDIVTLPGASNALAARVIEEVGFEAVYVTGAGIANTFHATPDIGGITLSELIAHVAAIREAVRLPLIVDADAGFGNALNVWRTVRDLEGAGADGIQLADRTYPRRPGPLVGESLIHDAEMVDKLTAAVEARRGPGILVARTDARTALGLEEACRRSNRYREAGADVLFIDGVQSGAELEIMAREVAGPKIVNLAPRGVTQLVSLERAAELGFTFGLFAKLPLAAGIAGMRDALLHLHGGHARAAGPPTATWDERQALVRKAEFDAMSDRYGRHAAEGDHPAERPSA